MGLKISTALILQNWGSTLLLVHYLSLNIESDEGEEYTDREAKKGWGSAETAGGGGEAACNRGGETEGVGGRGAPAGGVSLQSRGREEGETKAGHSVWDLYWQS